MVTRRMLMAAAGAALCPLPAFAQDDGPAQADAFGSDALHRGRATVPVRLNGQGPFSFMVDTAANASMIAGDLAERLSLPSLGDIGMHTLVAREIVPTVRVDRMESGTLEADTVRLAVGRRTAMAGLDGLLGCDLLLDRTVVLNFRGDQRARIAASRAPARGFLDRMASGIPVVVEGERRFGSLLMIPARIRGATAVAIVDSGAEGTILNRAAALAGRATVLLPSDGQTLRRVQSPTGEVTQGQAMLLPSMNFAGVTISNLAVAVGDFHSFDVWGLRNQPAMLIGLDVLRLFGAVHIDLKRNELSLRV